MAKDTEGPVGSCSGHLFGSWVVWGKEGGWNHSMTIAGADLVGRGAVDRSIVTRVGLHEGERRQVHWR